MHRLEYGQLRHPIYSAEGRTGGRRDMVASALVGGVLDGCLRVSRTLLRETDRAEMEALGGPERTQPPSVWQKL